MNWQSLPPLIIIASSLLPGLAIFFLPEHRHRLRGFLNLLGAALKVAIVAAILWGVHRGWRFETVIPMLPGLPLKLRLDALAMLFVALSATLWLLTTIYAIGYLEGSPQRSRFFGFFSLCVSATVGIAQAGNLFTLFFFYEVLTLSTWPLVIHRGTPEAMRAGRTYLAYTLAGSTVLLGGIVWAHVLAGPVDFAGPGGALAGTEASPAHLRAIFALLVAGFAVKAAMVPLHRWLPLAMVAPAPVSALLHAVAVVKAGAFGIVRVVYDVFGLELAQSLGVTKPLAAAAAVTIVYGSVQALRQDDLKRRLAYSTVSQISYIVLGAALASPIATIGGIVHLVHQGIMKITLFYCAGNIAETLGLHKIGELDGIGRRMPWTMGAFTVAGLGMMGMPPMVGFVSKWYLGTGAAGTGQDWVIAVLVASSLLNAAYFLPVINAAWFRPCREGAPTSRCEAKPSLLWPTLTVAALALLLGVFAGAPVSPLFWVRLIAQQEHF